MPEKIKYTLKDVGCYLDSSRGVYIGEEVQQFAKDHGWQDTPVSIDFEFYFDAWDEAEDYLNSSFPVDGASWGSNENGDWGLWKDKDDN